MTKIDPFAIPADAASRKQILKYKWTVESADDLLTALSINKLQPYNLVEVEFVSGEKRVVCKMINFYLTEGKSPKICCVVENCATSVRSEVDIAQVHEFRSALHALAMQAEDEGEGDDDVAIHEM